MKFKIEGLRKKDIEVSLEAETIQTALKYFRQMYPETQIEAINGESF